MPTEVASIAREHVGAYLADLFARGRSASTAKTGFGGLQAFFKWLLDVGEIARSPMERMRPPEVPDQPVDVLDDDAVRRLLARCSGRDFAAVRDTAIIRLFIDSWMRVGEMAGLGVEDLDFEVGTGRVLGKGRRTRLVPFGTKTALALRRYLRVRSRHRDAQSPGLWLGKLGPFKTEGIKQMLQRRGDGAGIAGLHAHQFRHTFAHEWLSRGGSEGDLMRTADRASRSRQLVDLDHRSHQQSHWQICAAVRLAAAC